MSEFLKEAGKTFSLSAIAGAGLLAGAAALIGLYNLAGHVGRAVINLF